jgi:predicted membrane channel-forming protein YqfA (hemolysin III family)
MRLPRHIKAHFNFCGKHTALSLTAICSSYCTPIEKALMAISMFWIIISIVWCLVCECVFVRLKYSMQHSQFTLNDLDGFLYVARRQLGICLFSKN